MPKLDLMTMSGEKSKAIELPAFFAAIPKKELLHQAVVSFLANQRQSNAHTKTRGDVSGGGRKPWKQKGTGRARAGSSRSPIWVGGGITFGPRSDANYSKRFPVKMKRLALSMALSDKAANSKLLVIDQLALSEPKTKHIAAFLEKVAPQAKSILIVTPTVSDTLFRATRNLPQAMIISLDEINTYDVLRHEFLILTEETVKAINERFATDKTGDKNTTEKNQTEKNQSVSDNDEPKPEKSEK